MNPAPPSSEDRTASEINGLVDLRMFGAASRLIKTADLEHAALLAAACNYFEAIGDWHNAANLGLNLLAKPGYRCLGIAISVSLVLHNAGRSKEALHTLLTNPPDPDTKNAFSRETNSTYYYLAACCLSVCGHFEPSAHSLMLSFSISPEFWTKAFVDSDLRALWQWLGDQSALNEKLRHVLSKPAWLRAIAAVMSPEARFELDPRDLALYPRRREHLKHSGAHALSGAASKSDDPSLNALHSWLRSRAGWADHRLRKVIRLSLALERKAWSAQIGRRVVCIDDAFSSEVFTHFQRLPRKGQIYTIQAVALNRNSRDGELDPGFKLVELPSVSPSSNAAFAIRRFRLASDEETACISNQRFAR